MQNCSRAIFKVFNKFQECKVQLHNVEDALRNPRKFFIFFLFHQVSSDRETDILAEDLEGRLKFSLFIANYRLIRLKRFIS
jgi:hypothetical protein